MARRVWVISKRSSPTSEKTLADALANNCPEIAHGIPPVFKDIITEGMLPYAYEEPDQPEPILKRDPLKEIDALKERIESLEAIRIAK